MFEDDVDRVAFLRFRTDCQYPADESRCVNAVFAEQERVALPVPVEVKDNSCAGFRAFENVQYFQADDLGGNVLEVMGVERAESYERRRIGAYFLEPFEIECYARQRCISTSPVESESCNNNRADDKRNEATVERLVQRGTLVWCWVASGWRRFIVIGWGFGVSRCRRSARRCLAGLRMDACRISSGAPRAATSEKSALPYDALIGPALCLPASVVSACSSPRPW